MNLTRIMARAASGIAVLLLALALSEVAMAQESRGDESYAVFVSQRNGAAELFLIEVNTRQVSQLTNTGRGHLTPAVSSNRSIVFASREGSNYEIFSGTLSAALRSRRPTLVGINRLTVNTEDETAATTTRDGAWVSFLSGKGIEVMGAGGMDRKVIVPASELAVDFSPAISPDASRVAFVSNRGGEYEIWLYSSVNAELRQLTRGAKAAGGLGWSADGKQIVFNTTATSGESGIGMASVETGSFRVLTDKGDFNGSLSARGDRMLFTSTRDGDAELYLLNVGSGSVERLTFNAGMDDGAVFVTEQVRPGRATR
ncbi:MAG: TolB family protein [Blastocatellia bacterium]